MRSGQREYIGKMKEEIIVDRIDGKVIFNYQKALQCVSDNETSLKELLEEFIWLFPYEFKKLDEAVDRKKDKEAGIIAWKLRIIAERRAAKALVEAIHTIEVLAREGRLDNYGEARKIMLGEFLWFKESIRKKFPHLLNPCEPKKRILFLSNELELLALVRRLLYYMSKKWDMVFVSSGEEALVVMEQQPFDLVILDSDMERIDEVKVLIKQVKECYPKTACFVLSAGYHQSLKKLDFADRILEKPCSTVELKKAIIEKVEQ